MNFIAKRKQENFYFFSVYANIEGRGDMTFKKKLETNVNYVNIG